MQIYAWDAPTTLSRCIASCIATDAADVMRDGLKAGMAWGDRKPGEGMADFRKRACEPTPTRPDESCVYVYAMFAETWGSTALGFGGIGGQAMTTAYTVVLSVEDVQFLVYWAGRFAYALDARNPAFSFETFRADLGNQRTRSIGHQGHYFKKPKKASS